MVLLSLLASYLLGAVPVGLLVGRAVRGVDVRDHGSGNIGASNVWRTVGAAWGLLTFALDVGKGLAPVLVAHARAGHPAWLPVAAGLAAIVGHNFSVFLGFKGGKGVATTLGVAFGLSWAAGLAAFGVWLLVLGATRYISVASLAATPVGGLCLWAFNGREWAYGLFALLATVFVFVKHRSNLHRLRAGTEPKVGRKKKRPGGGLADVTLPSPLILASGSPRRRELLGLIGLPFDVRTSDFDEDSVPTAGLTPPEWVRRLAEGKARAVAAGVAGDALVLGADTTVVLDGAYLNKPADAADARRMLRALSGRTHEVHTGLCLLEVTGGRVVRALADSARTLVTFDTLSDAVIGAYVATGEPLDKAGAYGIQGKALSFIPGIQGDYFNVVGLPLFVLGKMLSQFGVSLWLP